MVAFDFPAWDCACRLVIDDGGRPLGSDRASAALAWLTRLLDEVDALASPVRADTTLQALAPRGVAGPDEPLLVDLLLAAEEARVLTRGAVTPFLAAPFQPVSQPIIQPGTAGASLSGAALTATADGGLSWPAGLHLDLGATAKARTADLAAGALAERLGLPILVSLGGDIATAAPATMPVSTQVSAPASEFASGDAPEGARLAPTAAGTADATTGVGHREPWQISVQDLPRDPEARIALEAGWAIATSSTQRRRWAVDPAAGSHLLDPATLRPVLTPWRTISVVAPTCLEANALATEAFVRGADAVATLRRHGRAARLVGNHGELVHLGGWPDDAELATPSPSTSQPAEEAHR